MNQKKQRRFPKIARQGEKEGVVHREEQHFQNPQSGGKKGFAHAGAEESPEKGGVPSGKCQGIRKRERKEDRDGKKTIQGRKTDKRNLVRQRGCSKVSRWIGGRRRRHLGGKGAPNTSSIKTARSRRKKIFSRREKLYIGGRK